MNDNEANGHDDKTLIALDDDANNIELEMELTITNAANDKRNTDNDVTSTNENAQCHFEDPEEHEANGNVKDPEEDEANKAQEEENDKYKSIDMHGYSHGCTLWSENWTIRLESPKATWLCTSPCHHRERRWHFWHRWYWLHPLERTAFTQHSARKGLRLCGTNRGIDAVTKELLTAGSIEGCFSPKTPRNSL